MLIPLDLTNEELREVYGYALGDGEPLPTVTEAAEYIKRKILRIATRKNR